MPVTTAVVPVAGRGTRLLPLSRATPKELLPLGRKPVLHHVIDELSLCGVEDIILVSSPGKDAITEYFADGPQSSQAAVAATLEQTGKHHLLPDISVADGRIRFSSVEQTDQLGLGHAVLCAREAVGNQPFIVALGDSTIEGQGQRRLLERMIEAFELEQASVVVAFQEVDMADVHRYGIAQPHHEVSTEIPATFRLADLIEKPDTADAPSNLAVSARYVLAPDIFEALEQTERGSGNEIQLTDAIRILIKNGHKCIGVKLAPEDTRYDVGRFETYYAAFLEYAISDPQLSESDRLKIRDAVRHRLETIG